MRKVLLQIPVMLTAVALVIFTSCSTPGLQGTYVPEYQDQQAQGAINGKTFVMNSTSSVISEAYLTVGMWSTSFQEPCGATSDQIYATFQVPAFVGTYYLVNSGGETRVELFDQDEGPEVFRTVYDGIIELISVDITNTNRVEGRLDMRRDDGNYINGNFSASVCNL